MTNIVKHDQRNTSLSVFSNTESFEHAQRIAKMLAASDLVPAQYKGNMANTLVALEMANRIGASPLAVMQNMYVIDGRPSWSSPFIIASLNTCGRFSPLRFKMEDKGTKEINVDVWEGPKGNRTKKVVKETVNNRECTAISTDLNGNEIVGPTVSIEMAVIEGWYGKAGSKWKTMPELMLRYRAAAFFGRLYAPEVMMGMQTSEEINDVHGGPIIETTATVVESTPITDINNLAKEKAKNTRKRATNETPEAVIIAEEKPTTQPSGQAAETTNSDDELM